MILLLLVPSPAVPVVMGTVNPVSAVSVSPAPTASITPLVPTAAITVH